MLQFIPAPLPASWHDLEAAVAAVSGASTRIQVDIVDGEYAPEATWPYNGIDQTAFRDLIEERRGLPEWDRYSFELDLMVMKPEESIREWVSAGFDTTIIHFETTEKHRELIDAVKERGANAALALKPSTDIAVLEPFIEEVEFVQCMGNDKVGYHGVSLDPSVLEKIKIMKARWPELTIGIDIGVSLETIADIVGAGVTHVAAWSAIMKTDDEPRVAIEKLRAEAARA